MIYADVNRLRVTMYTGDRSIEKQARAISCILSIV